MSEPPVGRMTAREFLAVNFSAFSDHSEATALLLMPSGKRLEILCSCGVIHVVEDGLLVREAMRNVPRGIAA